MSDTAIVDTFAEAFPMTAARAIVNEGAAAPAGDWSALAVFAPVHDIKSRRDCVLLPFEALAKALG